MNNYIQLLVLFFIFTLLLLFSNCQKQAVEKKVEHQVVKDSLTTDSTLINTNERSYPSEPKGYKGIHQQEKEQHDKKK